MVSRNACMFSKSRQRPACRAMVSNPLAWHMQAYKYGYGERIRERERGEAGMPCALFISHTSLIDFQISAKVSQHHLLPSFPLTEDCLEEYFFLQGSRMFGSWHTTPSPGGVSFFFQPWHAKMAALFIFMDDPTTEQASQPCSFQNYFFIETWCMPPSRVVGKFLGVGGIPCSEASLP